MIYKLSNQLINYLENNNVLKQEKGIYEYGARLVISTIIGTSLLLLIGLVSGHIVDAIIYELIMSSSRCILGGYHCKSYAKCIYVYVGIFVLILICLSIYEFQLLDIIFIQSIGFIITIICCPVKNINKEVSVQKTRVFKRYSYLFMIVLISVMAYLYFINSQYTNLVVYIFIIINLLTMGGKIDYEKHKE